MTQVICNGEWVDVATIGPTTHRFVGSFRPPQPPDAAGAAVLICTCMANLWTVEGVRSHWLMGHFDVPQYERLGGADRAAATSGTDDTTAVAL
jgi:hypothetical protein